MVALDDIRPGQHVAGHRDVLPAHLAGPIDAARAGVLGDAAARIQDMELALRTARVRHHAVTDHHRRVRPLAQARQGVQGIERVDQRLGGQGGNPALDMDAHRAHCEEPGGNGSAEAAGGRVTHEDGPGHGRRAPYCCTGRAGSALARSISRQRATLRK